jgi:hypothetical protein
MPSIPLKVIAEWRNRIETTFSEITDRMELARHGAHTFWGLLTPGPPLPSPPTPCGSPASARHKPTHINCLGPCQSHSSRAAESAGCLGEPYRSGTTGQVRLVLNMAGACRLWTGNGRQGQLARSPRPRRPRSRSHSSASRLAPGDVLQWKVPGPRRPRRGEGSCLLRGSLVELRGFEHPDLLNAMHGGFVPGGLAGSALCRSGRYASLRSSC